MSTTTTGNRLAAVTAVFYLSTAAALISVVGCGDEGHRQANHKDSISTSALDQHTEVNETASHEEIEELISQIDVIEIQGYRTLSDKYDSPAARRLVEIGLPALESTLGLLLEEDLGRRRRGCMVMARISRRVFGADATGNIFTNPQDEEEWEQFWKTYACDEEASAQERQRVVEKWRSWIAALEVRQTGGSE